MAKARVTFQKLIQDSQDYQSSNPNDDHMISQAFFALEIGGQLYEDMRVEVSQPYGTNYESEPVEVHQPVGSYDVTKGNWNHHEFADLVERYYRQFIGSQARGIQVSGAINLRMRNNTFVSAMTGEFTIPD